MVVSSLTIAEDRADTTSWICPNGGDSCMYRHALPPGFVLKKDKKDDKKEVISLEEFVEVEVGDSAVSIS